MGLEIDCGLEYWAVTEEVEEKDLEGEEVWRKIRWRWVTWVHLEDKMYFLCS